MSAFDAVIERTPHNHTTTLHHHTIPHNQKTAPHYTTTLHNHTTIPHNYTQLHNHTTKPHHHPTPPHHHSKNFTATWRTDVRKWQRRQVASRSWWLRWSRAMRWSPNWKRTWSWSNFKSVVVWWCFGFGGCGDGCSGGWVVAGCG